MTFLSDFQERAGAIASLPPVEVAAVSALPDEDVVALLTAANALANAAERVRTVAAGVIAARSTRAAGHKGLAQGRGHRNAVALVQELSGTTRGDAARQVRVGQSLVETALHGTDGAGEDGAGADAPGSAPDSDSGAAPLASPAPWHEPLDRALLSGVLTSAQMDAILRGLGRPPLPDAAAPGTDTPTDAATVAAEAAAATEAAIEAWRVAAEQLAGVASECTVEDLAATARRLRDRLDPEGAEARFLARHEARSFRMWTDPDGIHHAKVVFDDEGAAWVRSLIDAALRPRRGGPRFIDPTEATKADELSRDPRSNEQLTYDVILDTLRTGTLADPETVFGTRQPGVRLITTIDTLHGRRDSTGRPVGTGHTEDGGHSLPAPALEHAICTTGYTPVTVDQRGNPLDVGREHRLFTPRQRIALAVRDGGCRWPGCTMPASYCEAHHIDEWAAHTGRTDTHRGILLCRFHHMNLHHHGHRITRHRDGPFLLHPPGGAPPIPMPTRSPLRWQWTPPPQTDPDRRPSRRRAETA